VTVLHFVCGLVLTINVRNYFGNLFANYYTAVYSVVTATNFAMVLFNMPQHPPPTGIEYLSLSGVCAFQTLTPPLLKFHKYRPGVMCAKRDTQASIAQNAIVASVVIYLRFLLQ